jgi:CDP-paratose 2-epimerase
MSLGVDSGPALIVGGAGFIGTNLAATLAGQGGRVIVYDNFSRAGVERNAASLRDRFGDRVELVLGDVRDVHRLRGVVERASVVFHLAAQVAVTTSLADPVTDFEVNARGTLNVLEAIRRRDDPPPLLYTSTNKVYGALDDVGLEETEDRYEPRDRALRERGVDESRPLDFHSPYGCSKGAADQYVLDHARTFGLPALVFRMSCIYGPHQHGTEDQGWVAHFVRRALANEPVTLYGSGRQVRDLLHVDDLVKAMTLAVKAVERTRGRAFNIGGGPERTASLRELLETIGRVRGREVVSRSAEARPGDQRYYVSDTRRFGAATGWAPQIPVEQGVRELATWFEGVRRGGERLA